MHPSLRIFPVFLLLCTACTPDQQYQMTARAIKNQWRDAAFSKKEWPELLTFSEIQSSEDFIQNKLRQLANYQFKSLSAHNQADLNTLQIALQKVDTTLQKLRKDPTQYDFAQRLQATFSQSDLSSDQKLRGIARQLPLAGSYYQHAKENLQPADAQLCAAAVERHVSGLTYLNREINLALQQNNLPKADRAVFQNDFNRMKLALMDYLAWCRSQAFELRAKE